MSYWINLWDSQVSLKKYVKLAPATFTGFQLGAKSVAIIRTSGNITGADSQGGGLSSSGITANEVGQASETLLPYGQPLLKRGSPLRLMNGYLR